MAQLEAAAGGEAVVADSSRPDPIHAIEAIEAIEDWVDDFLGEEEEEQAGAGDAGDREEEADGGAESGAEEEAAEQPIDPPISLTAEEKEAFKSWPRDAQEAFSRRIGDLERGFQSKAQEAAYARQHAEREALQQVQQLSHQYAQQLHYALPEVPDRPSYQLQIDDPVQFAEQMDAHERAVAQHHHVQQQIHYAQLHAQQAEHALQVQAAQEFQAVLQHHFPEFLSDAKLQSELGSIAVELGYPAERLSQADAQDILGLKKVHEWKAKADKLDALNRAKMDNVRAAKSLPPVARPGAARTAAQNSAARREAAWQRVKETKDPNAFADYLGL